MRPQVREITADDAAIYYPLRLRALRDHPEAFESSYEESRDRPIEEVAQRIRAYPPDNFILGAFAEDKMCGVVGFARGGGTKTRHRGMIWGTYVVPEKRGTGLAGVLLDETIRRVKAMDGVEQIVLAVTIGNEAARRLYVSAGFKPYAVDRGYLKIAGQYYDLEWMRLDL